MDALFRRMFALETRAFRLDSATAKDGVKLLAMEQDLRNAQQRLATTFGTVFGDHGITGPTLFFKIVGCNSAAVAGVPVEIKTIAKGAQSFSTGASLGTAVTDATGLVGFTVPSSYFASNDVALFIYPDAATGYYFPNATTARTTYTSVGTYTVTLSATIGRLCTATCDRLFMASNFTLTSKWGTTALVNTNGVLTCTQHSTQGFFRKGYYRDDGTGNPVPGEVWFKTSDFNSVFGTRITHRLQINGDASDPLQSQGVIYFKSSYPYYPGGAAPVGSPDANAGTSPASSGYTLATTQIAGSGSIAPSACSPLSASITLGSDGIYPDAENLALTLNEV